MNNREKFRDEILKLSRDMEEGNLCIIKKRYVLPHLFKDVTRGSCNGVNCAWCNVLIDVWLDEECEEPTKIAVDWSKVPVDTLVRVRNDKSATWLLRYFKAYDHGELAPYLTWVNGATSATSGGFLEQWKYCELVEDEDDE